MLNIGCHLSKKKGLLVMAESASSIGANSIQFFTRNPRGGHERPINPTDLCKFQLYIKQHGIKHLLAYAPYTLEPASDEQAKRDFTAKVISEDMARMESVPHQGYLLRPGSALKQQPADAQKNLAALLNEVLAPAQTTTLLLYTMPGAGTQICSKFDELANVLGEVNLADHVGVCFDASAVWAAGYDIVNDLDGVLEEFDKTVGLGKLEAVHLNDCKEGCGSHVDRHARIGEGTIGFEALSALTKHPALRDLPFYLEEPLGTLSIYGEDVARFKKAAE